MVFPVIPVILAGSAIASAVSGIAGQYYNNKTAQAGLAWQKALQQENSRFWRDYERNTGITPLYPYRSGYNFNTVPMESYQNSLDYSVFGYGSSVVHGISGIAGIYGSYAGRNYHSDPGYRDWYMYR